MQGKTIFPINNTDYKLTQYGIKNIRDYLAEIKAKRFLKNENK